MKHTYIHSRLPVLARFLGGPRENAGTERRTGLSISMTGSGGLGSPSSISRGRLTGGVGAGVGTGVTIRGGLRAFDSRRPSFRSSSKTSCLIVLRVSSSSCDLIFKHGIFKSHSLCFILFFTQYAMPPKTATVSAPRTLDPNADKSIS